MPICIECGEPVSQLYHVFKSRNQRSAAPTPSNASQNASQRSSSANLAPNPPPPQAPPPAGEASSPVGSSDVRLTQCPRCKLFADKYVEHDYVVLFIDLVLIKPQVYRHILFNRFSHDAETLDPSIRKLGILLLLFDVYITQIHIYSLPQPSSKISHLNVFIEWGFFVLVCGFASLMQHLTIRLLADLVRLCQMYPEPNHTSSDNKESEPESHENATSDAPAPAEPPWFPTSASISTALFVSSCMSIFPIFMIVWRPDETDLQKSTIPSTASRFLPKILQNGGRGVSWVRSGVAITVTCQNLEALKIVLSCGYLPAGCLVAAGAVMRWAVRVALLEMVGLSES